jgi:hypothetical protein
LARYPPSSTKGLSSTLRTWSTNSSFGFCSRFSLTPSIAERNSFRLVFFVPAAQLTKPNRRLLRASSMRVPCDNHPHPGSCESCIAYMWGEIKRLRGAEDRYTAWRRGVISRKNMLATAYMQKCRCAGGIAPRVRAGALRQLRLGVCKTTSTLSAER